MPTFLTIINTVALGILIFMCIVRLSDLKGKEKLIESVALIFLSFAACGQSVHYIKAPHELELIDVIFNATLSIMALILTEREWRKYVFLNRRQVQEEVSMERRHG